MSKNKTPLIILSMLFIIALFIGTYQFLTKYTTYLPDEMMTNFTSCNDGGRVSNACKIFFEKDLPTAFENTKASGAWPLPAVISKEQLETTYEVVNRKLTADKNDKPLPTLNELTKNYLPAK